jgi:hypothetical protein
VDELTVPKVPRLIAVAGLLGAGILLSPSVP